MSEKPEKNWLESVSSGGGKHSFINLYDAAKATLKQEFAFKSEDEEKLVPATKAEFDGIKKELRDYARAIYIVHNDGLADEYSKCRGNAKVDIDVTQKQRKFLEDVRHDEFTLGLAINRAYIEHGEHSSYAKAQRIVNKVKKGMDDLFPDLPPRG